jgi:uncharacterized membrane protein YkoI
MISLPATLASTLLLAAPAALAAQPVTAPGNTAMHESQADLAAFQKVKVSLDDAIAAAEKHSGGKVLDIYFESHNGMPSYRVRTYQADGVWAGWLDANSGQFVGKGTTTPESKLNRADKAEIAELQKARISLPTAVTTAERQLSGKAIAGGIEDLKGKVTYETMVLKNGTIHRGMVDPMSGSFAAS